MALSHEMLALHHKEDEYVGDYAFVGITLVDKELHMLAAPTKTGKTRVLDRVVDILPDSAVAATFTSRARKEGDPLNYITASEGLTVQRLKELILDERMVNYAIFPSGDIYGTLPKSYPATHNFLPTMTNAVTQLEHAGFEKTTLSYLTLAGQAWKGIVLSETAPSKMKPRMEEAVASLMYAKDHAETVHFVRNRIGQTGLAQAVNDLISTSVGGGQGYDKDRAIDDLDEMLAIAKDLAVRSE